MGGAAGAAFVVVILAAAGAFGFVAFLAAKAPEVETARIARLRTSTDGGLTIGFEHVHSDRQSDRQHAEFWLVALLRICRALTAYGLLPRKKNLGHQRARVRPTSDDISADLRS